MSLTAPIGELGPDPRDRVAPPRAKAGSLYAVPTDAVRVQGEARAPKPKADCRNGELLALSGSCVRFGGLVACAAILLPLSPYMDL